MLGLPDVLDWRPVYHSYIASQDKFQFFTASDQWGVDGLRKAAAGSAAQSVGDVVQTIFTSMDEFSRGRQHDDATVVVIRVH